MKQLILDIIFPCFCQNNIYGYEYNSTCYKSCPKKTNVLSNISYLCQDLNCELEGKYYDYNQTKCIETIPEGFYSNDSDLKTIDYCHQDCKTCNNKETENNSNCQSCNETQLLYLGNCINTCNYGYFNNSNNDKICYCPNEKCKGVYIRKFGKR